MGKRQLLLMSSSRLHGHEYLEHARTQIDYLLKKNNVKTVLFVPYALKNHEEYTKLVGTPLIKWGYNINGLHSETNPIEAIKKAEAIFIGGGNTFVLLKTLYEKNLIEPIQQQILIKGTPYIGSSAGTNVATKSIHTTNDMPVAYPPSFNGLGLVPFNINPHYIETDPTTSHKGETRDQRINEFLEYHNLPVLGLREGTSLLVEDNNIKLLGINNAKLFNPGAEANEYSPDSDLSFLLK